jgi:Tol biopolymer transport system component
VRVFEIATGVTTTLTSGVGTESLPAWSPDGSDVAFVRELRGTSDPDGPITGVFSVSVESGEESEVARFEGVTYFELQLSWSHSGERLAILVPSSGKARIFSVGSDGSDQILIATGGFREYTKLGWTEDDKQIVVTSAYTGI